MQQVTIAGTDLGMSRLGFGTASMHHLLRRQDRERLVGTALDGGFTHFDTARMYGEGIAERTLGRYLGARRQQVTLATKFGIPADPWLERAPLLIYPQRTFDKVARAVFRHPTSERRRCFSRQCLQASVRASLRALRTDWIDIFFVHEPRIAEIESLLAIAEDLDHLRQAGTARYLGLAGQASECLAVARETGDLYDVLQVEDSVDLQEADSVLGAGRPLQITYGYLGRAGFRRSDSDVENIVGRALARNNAGCVLVSSRKPERVQALAKCAK